MFQPQKKAESLCFGWILMPNSALKLLVIFAVIKVLVPFALFGLGPVPPLEILEPVVFYVQGFVMVNSQPLHSLKKSHTSVYKFV